MPYNGAGNFVALTPPNFPAVAGTLIRAEDYNAVIYDLIAGLTNAITRDGQSPPVNNLPMAGMKHTGVADATANDQYASYGQLLTPRSPVLGGTAASSTLTLQSTSGAGTSYPATTTDNIVFKRGANGAQMLGQFTPGGSFGVGDWTRWSSYSVNEHAGDDGTGVRVSSVMAETAALFIGQTVRNNAESGGPVGRSIVSFEGYRLANAAGSRESGALRVITEGVSATQLGARVSILTRRDGFTETDFVERWTVQNDGNLYHGGGVGGVGNANRSGYAYGNTVYTISGQTGRSVIEQTTNAADADQTIIGDHSFVANFQTDEKRIALMQGVLTGSTATKRGGEVRWYLKPDNAGLAEVFRLTAYGIKDAKPQGTLQAAPTLVITANVITPAAPISFLGAGLVKTITVPANFVAHGGRVTLIPTAAFTTDTTGNIALASTAVINRAIDFVYDGGTGKWYPTY